ncbi:MAG: tRNA uridine-5-carboxymethylaminomethyl(34) synthesis GTPase MnmE [Bacteroidales bacterium]|nr:tRNA uridine-5-carboxymethylaminomethyl(34) synthesis GTPase MnmE [Bacteroidales bacterium]
MEKRDTICAISTPVGKGGIAVARISGREAKVISEHHLCSLKGKAVTLHDRRAKVCRLCDGYDFVDEVVVIFFAAPHSYTGEDVVEISCHGSLYVQERLLRLLCDGGARMAEPGEFTLRAFLNGRLNLSQAEAVADLIDSQSKASHGLAVSQMRGGYARELEELRQQFVDLAALLELELDFSDEEVEFADRRRIRDTVNALKQKVSRLIDSFRMGNAIKNGVPVAIVGAPNAGKSSLLNALLREDRAIVSPVPGTTRDTVEETLSIDGIMFRFIDTAGLRDSDDSIEKLGIERSRKAIEKAQIVIVVHDVSAGPDEEAEAMFADVSQTDRIILLVHNKCDLVLPPYPDGLTVSAKTGLGVDELKQSMIKAFREKMTDQGDVLLTNARHYEAMGKVLSALIEVEKGMDSELPTDLMVIDIRDALYHLGTITGKVTSDEVLSSVFSRFCIGK